MWHYFIRYYHILGYFWSSPIYADYGYKAFARNLKRAYDNLWKYAGEWTIARLITEILSLSRWVENRIKIAEAWNCVHFTKLCPVYVNFIRKILIYSITDFDPLSPNTKKYSAHLVHQEIINHTHMRVMTTLEWHAIKWKWEIELWKCF